MVGFAPPSCQPCHLISEEFLAEDAGAWQYQLVLQTETQQVEVCHKENRPLFIAAHYRRPDQDLNPDLKPKK
ncbi:Gp37 protein [Mycobacteroides abscessus subsp. massiliense]|nr:Gp37 protein [Mycobacteroides abscessus subsp. massiliense]